MDDSLRKATAAKCDAITLQKPTSSSSYLIVTLMMCLAIPLPVRYMYHIIQLNRVLRKPPNDVAANLDVRPHPTSIHDKVYKQIHVPRMPTTMRALLLYTCIRTDRINYIVCPVVAYDSNNHAAPPRGTSTRDFTLPREKVKSQKTAVLKKNPRFLNVLQKGYYNAMERCGGRVPHGNLSRW